jgi:drug/metabolite transporter (DMT)-like permease
MGEQITKITVVGAILIIAGVIIVYLTLHGRSNGDNPGPETNNPH